VTFLLLPPPVTGPRGLIENLESPLLKDVTAPMGRIVSQIRSGNFDIDSAIQAAKVCPPLVSR
jgi:hypothetical protein